jgi:hypothetical protein
MRRTRSGGPEPLTAFWSPRTAPQTAVPEPANSPAARDFSARVIARELRASDSVSPRRSRNTSCIPATAVSASAVVDCLSKRQFAAVRFWNLREYNVYSRNRLRIALSNTGVDTVAVCRFDIRSDFSTAPLTLQASEFVRARSADAGNTTA